VTTTSGTMSGDEQDDEDGEEARRMHLQLGLARRSPRLVSVPSVRLRRLGLAPKQFMTNLRPRACCPPRE
jgi:hypothetical protein